MPEETPTTTILGAELSAKTTAAVQDTGFGKEFDAEFDTALASDAAAREAVKKGEAAPPKPAEKPAEKPDDKPAKAAQVTPDIPESLLGKKKTAEEPKGDAATDEDREKFIKEQTTGLSPKAADRFRALEKSKHEAEQRAAKVEKLEKELTTAQEKLKTATDSSATTALQKQIEELDAIVQKNALTEHPKFKAAFDGKITKEIDIAKKLVDAESASEVAALLSLPESRERNRRLNELVDDLDPIEAGKFQRAVDNIDRLTSEKTSELENWRANKSKMVELAEQDTKTLAERRKASVDSALNSVLPKFTDDEKGIELFRKVDGNEEWNKSVDNRLDQVRKLTAADLAPQDVAEMAAWAMSGAEYRKLFLTQRVLVQKLQEEIASMKGGEPDLGAGHAAAAEVEEKGGMVDVVARLATKEGAVR